LSREYIDTVIYISEITRGALYHTYRCKSKSRARTKSYVAQLKFAMNHARRFERTLLRARTGFVNLNVKRR